VNDVVGLSADIATLPVAEVALRLGQPVSRVHQLVRDGHLLSFRRDGEVVVPSDFLGDDGVVIKGLSGTITVLRDGGYADDDILRWLFQADSSLGIAPIQALRSGRKTEVRRVAQALAF
jgi:hypothetical protein